MIRFYLVGDLSIEHAAGVIGSDRLGGRQARLVLVRLGWEPGLAVSRDELAGLLWGEEPPASWETALAAVVSNLRSILAPVEEVSIAHEFGGYRLSAPADSWTDVRAAREAIHEAEGALQRGRMTEVYAWTGVATSITRRPFLPGEESEWIERCRNELASIRRRGLEAAVEFCLWNREYPTAVRYAESLVEMSPFRESAHRGVMRAHAAAGDRAEAIRAYERCRRLLAEELGVSPSAETEALYESLLG
jgi:DNA-binding SARP family transcriptional activator